MFDSTRFLFGRQVSSRRWLAWLLQAVLLITVVGCAGGEEGEGDEEVREKQVGLSTDFTNEVVTPGISQPMSLRFLPDGRLLVLRKTGEIVIGDPSLPLPMATELYMKLSNIDSGLERGLFDLALDPNFGANGQFYLLYTAASPKQTRVSRFTHLENGGGTASRGQLSSEQVLWEDIDGFPQCCHYGGSVDFGPDGKLYVTIGDKFDEDASQNLNKPSGSILRMNADGSIPADNPFVDGSGPQVDQIWAYGLRNPFRARWDLPTNRLFISEVGGNDLQNSYEDLHVSSSSASAKGVNFGWPFCEGPPPHTGTCASTPHEDPIYTYKHAGKNAAIIAGPVYRGTQFPSSFVGRFFFGDFSRETIRYLTFDENGEVSGDFDFEEEAGPVVALDQGPDGMLYYVTISGGVGRNVAEGDLRRIYYNSGNQPPQIVSQEASPEDGTAPLNVQFTAEVNDADGDSMTFEWDFGDGDKASGAVDPSGMISVNHQYDANGQYNALLRVSDPQRTTASAPLVIRVGVPPAAVIDSPADGSTFRAGEIIEFSGSAEDADEMNPDDVTYSWVVQFGHDNHFHPVLGPVSLGPEGSSFDVNQAAHDFLGDTDFRIDLTVTDSEGLTDHTFVEIRPEKVIVTLDSDPPGAELFVDFTPVDSPRMLDSIIGWKHHVSAPTVRCVDGVQYVFSGWSDDGAAAHDLTVPDHDVTVTAEYDDVGTCMNVELPVMEGLVFQVKADLGISAGADGAVGGWSDQSDNGQVLGTVSGEPLWLPNELNGHAAVRFDGDDDAMGASNVDAFPTGSSDRTVMMVARYQSAGWGGFAWGNLGCNRAFGIGVANTGVYAVQGWCPANDSKSDQTPSAQDWVMQSAVVTANNMSHYVNGELIGSFSHTYDTGTARLRLGRNLDDTTFIQMDVAEILVFDRALTDSERAQVEEYFEAEYFGPASGGNAPPTAVDDQASIGAPGGSTTVTVLANDSDSDGSLVPSTVTLVGEPQHGMATVGAGTGAITYVHDGSANLTDFFQYVVRDDQNALSNTATVHVTVGGGCAGSDCLPVDNGLVMWLQGDQGVSVDSSGVTGWADQSGHGHGLSVISGAPQLLAGGLNGHTTVRFDGVDDGLGLASPPGLPSGAADRHIFMVADYRGLGAQGWAGFAWGAANCNKVFGAVSTPAGQAGVQGWCGANDFASNSAVVGSGFLVQEVRLASDSLTHYLDGQEIDSHTHTYNTGTALLRLGVELNDRNRVDMDVAEVLVYDRALSAQERTQVNAYLSGRYFAAGGPDNQAPVAQNDSATAPGSGLVEIPVLANDSDADGSLDPATVTISGAPSHGTVSVDLSSGVLTYLHDGSSATSDSFGYTVRDDDGALSNVATVSIEVQISGGCAGSECVVPIENGLVMWLQADQAVTTSGGDVTTWSDLSVSGNDLAVISGAPQYNPMGLNGRATVEFDGSDDAMGRSNPVALPAGAEERTVFLVAKYESAGWGGFTWGTLACGRVFGLAVNKAAGNLAVQGWCVANDFPSATLGNGADWLTQAAVYDGATLLHYANGTQIDQEDHVFNTGAALLRLGSELNDRAKVKMSVAEVLVYDRALSAADVSRIEDYLAGRYFGQAENAVPVAGDDSAQLAQGGSVAIDVLENDTDADGDLVPSKVAIASEPSHGQVTVNPVTGAVTYVHDGLGSTADAFTYTVEDAEGAVSAPATVTLTIEPDPCAGGACDAVPVSNGLALWLQADQGLTTLGGSVSEWADQSGVGNTLNKLFGDPQQVAGGLNGHDVVRFDGTDDGLGRDGTSGLATGSGPRTVYLVAKFGAGQRLGLGGVAWGNLTCNRAFGLVTSGASGNLAVQGWCPANDFVSGASATAADWAVHGLHYDGSAYSLTLDGMEIATGAHTFDTGAARLRLGIELNDRSKFPVDVAEVLVYNRSLSAAERTQVESYLHNRYLP